MLNVNGQIANENIDIANIFNDYFINLSTALSSNNNMNTGYTETIATLREFTQTKLEPETEFRIRQIDESEVFTMLNRLNVNKSAGVDSLGPRLLKLAAPAICHCVYIHDQ